MKTMKNNLTNTYIQPIFSSHTCHKCGKSFSKKESLRKHKQNHPNETKLACDLCDLDFKTKIELVNHVKRKHVNKKLIDNNLTEYRCENCKISFLSDETLKKHIMRSHKEDNKLDCDECDYQTFSFQFLEKHVQITHRPPSQSATADVSEAKYQCKDCGQEFTEKWTMMNHMRDTHGKSKRKCRYKDTNECKHGSIKCWYSHDDESDPQSDSFESVSITCKVCQNSFSSKSQLLKHRKSEHKETVPMCREIKEGKICRFPEDQCWYRHDVNIQKKITPTTKTRTIIPQNDQVFQKNSQPIRPPDQLEEIKNIIQNLMREVNQLKLKQTGNQTVRN